MKKGYIGMENPGIGGFIISEDSGSGLGRYSVASDTRV